MSLPWKEGRGISVGDREGGTAKHLFFVYFSPKRKFCSTYLRQNKRENKGGAAQHRKEEIQEDFTMGELNNWKSPEADELPSS